MVRDFRGVLDREGAEMGLFICLNKPTKAMTTEAASAGIADTVHGDLPKLQIVSIEEWFQDKLPKLPPLNSLPSAAFSSAKRRAAARPKQKQPDPKAPEFMFEFSNVALKEAKDTVRHLNPQMVRKAG